jgi:CP family cyanate transporter-like MFS transporter
VASPFLSAPGDIPRLSAGIFTISYSTAVLVPTTRRLLCDLTGLPAAAFVPLAVCAIAIAGIASTLSAVAT